MVKEVILVANLAEDVPKTMSDYVGIDRGALILATQGIHMEFAIGDFDSISESEYQVVKAFAKEIIQLNPIKDASDSQLAIEECTRRGYTKGILYGALGGRLDHQYVNQHLCLLEQFDCTCVDHRNRMFSLRVGTHVIQKNQYVYCSFFAIDEVVVTLEGFKYPLHNYRLERKNLIGLSNEIVADEATVQVIQGQLLCIQTR